MAHGLFARLRHVADAGLTLLFPSECVGCGRWGAAFCDSCAQAVEATPEPHCARCGRVQPTASARCPRCRHHGEDLPLLTRSAALHTKPLRQAIHAFKYQNQPQLAPFLARYLVAVFAQPPWSTLPQPISAVVPVPLHEQRLAERGYNQSAFLATHFCRTVGLPLQSTWLTRTRHTAQQVGLGPRERQANVQGAFSATTDVRGHNLLLIDDVYTTSATLRACTTAALAAGAKSVYALTLAQPSPSPISTPQEPPNDDFGAIDQPWWESEL